MSKIPLFLILVFFVSVVAAASVFDAEVINEKPLLRDGFVMMGVDGTLIGPDSNDVYFFELLSDVNDYRVVLKAGIRLELLPSLALEKMIAYTGMDRTNLRAGLAKSGLRALFCRRMSIQRAYYC